MNVNQLIADLIELSDEDKLKEITIADDEWGDLCINDISVHADKVTIHGGMWYEPKTT